MSKGSRTDLPPLEDFTTEGRRIAYRVYGAGPQVVVLIHGLLMDGRMFSKLGPTLARRGHQVICVDMLGHGGSDQPHDMNAYSMPQFGQDVIALLDHLGIAQAVIGGTSLGANVALEAAVASPKRVRALFIEMPVLENGLAGAAAVFVPLALAIRIARRSMGVLSWLTRKIPRSHFLVDVMIDFVRRDPVASLAVLDGLTFGRVAPPRSERRKLTQPTLAIGHMRDPIHPFSDADTLARELPQARMVQARSIYEWRLAPSRLDDALCSFLDDVWSRPRAVAAG